MYIHALNCMGKVPALFNTLPSVMPMIMCRKGVYYRVYSLLLPQKNERLQSREGTLEIIPEE